MPEPTGHEVDAQKIGFKTVLKSPSEGWRQGILILNEIAAGQR